MYKKSKLRLILFLILFSFINFYPKDNDLNDQSMLHQYLATNFNNNNLFRLSPKNISYKRSSLMEQKCPTTYVFDETKMEPNYWLKNGNPICIEGHNQIEPILCSDGEGGAIFAWLDNRNPGSDTPNYDIYVQKVDSNGLVNWTNNGLEFCTESHSQEAIQICSDLDGGAIVTWQDWRAPTEYDIYIKKVNKNGSLEWGPIDGLPVCTIYHWQTDPQICTDGEGGAIVTWLAHTDTEAHLYAQRINSSGSLIWKTGGVPVRVNGIVLDHKICSDNQGGAFITWREYKEGNTDDIYIQRVNSSGSLQWDNNGVPVCVNPALQFNPEICDDGEGGVIISWSDARGDYTSIFAQKVNSTGQIQWNSNGVHISNNFRPRYNQKMVTDGDGGIIIVWESGYIYAQRLDKNGNIVWSDYSDRGIQISFVSSKNLNLVRDEKGGAIIVWETNSIFAQHIDNDGILLWNQSGESICTEISDQSQLCFNGNGSALISWRDYRNGNQDIYAYNLKSAAPTSNHPSNLITSIDRSETINWTLSDDIGGGKFRVLVNYTLEDTYVWINWTSWISDTPLNIIINRTEYGNFNYTIEYYDIHGIYGVPDSINVLIKEDLIPWVNHPDDIINPIFDPGTINWTLFDDFGGGKYQIIVNCNLSKEYIWLNWTDWIPNNPLHVHINNTSIGTFNYTINFYDDKNNFGIQDTVVVELLENLKPTSNHPPDLTTAYGRDDTLQWILSDDFGGGYYRILINNQKGFEYVWRNWTPWSSEVPINIPINYTQLGIFNYMIDYYDINGLYGDSDSIMVTIKENQEPISNHPEDLHLMEGKVSVIRWRLSDDFGGGEYRILLTIPGNSTNLYRAWTAWDNGTSIEIPISNFNQGTYVFQIEFYDDQYLEGTSDTVSVFIEPRSKSPNYLPVIIIGTLGVSFLIIIPIVYYLKKRR